MLKLKKIKKENILKNPKEYLGSQMLAVLYKEIIMGHIYYSENYYFEITSDNIYTHICSLNEISEYYLIKE